MERTTESRTFHYFSRLPKELRDHIWSLAIRPDRPGAHFFTVFESRDNDEWAQLSQYSLRHQHPRRCALAAPRCGPSDADTQHQLSWTRDNRSVYLIDSGLWTACTESRAAMERHFKVAEWDARRAETRRPPYAGFFDDAPATAWFTSGGQWQRCLTIPRMDLFFLQPFVAETVDWERLPLYVAFFSRLQRLYTGHVALVYDPALLADLRSTEWPSWGLMCAMMASEQLDWAENLWFVDCRIRRDAGAPPTTSSRHRFHGDGCIFTEVREGDACWKVDRTGDLFEFLQEMNEMVEESFEAEPERFDGCRAPRLGILAYEEC